MYIFDVIGHPKGKEQHRISRHTKLNKAGKPYHPHYTPQATEEYKQKIITAFKVKYPGKHCDPDAEWELLIHVYYKGRCDWDKIGNAVSDALQGILWTDDERIMHGEVTKVRITKDTPRKEYVSVCVKKL
jgi:Holliday junction resolvase RusA-like endonuclease